jgi:hypothetical protein
MGSTPKSTQRRISQLNAAVSVIDGGKALPGIHALRCCF